MQEDLEILEKQLAVNNKRIKKLEEHKKSTELELKKLQSKKELEVLLETLKRIEKNLKIEYKMHEGIIKAMNSQEFNQHGNE